MDNTTPAEHTTEANAGTTNLAPEYPFTPSAIAHATAPLLGDGWVAKSGPGDVVASLQHAKRGWFSIGTDDEGNFGVRRDESPRLRPELYVECTADSLDAVAKWTADAVRRLIVAHRGTGVNLLGLHIIDASIGGVPNSCTCQRAACGAAESGPGIPSGGGRHTGIATESHLAVDCPALPADTDLSRLHIVISERTADGPVTTAVIPYTRDADREVRQGDAPWDLALGDDPDDAARQWAAYVDEMRAYSAAAQARAITEAAERRRLHDAGSDHEPGEHPAESTAPTPYDPAPGAEYSYPLSDYARAAARSLGTGWAADSGYLGAWGLIFTTDDRVSLRLYVDDDDGSTGDLMIEDRKTGDEHLVPSCHLPEAPRTPDEMREWGDELARFIIALDL